MTVSRTTAWQRLLCQGTSEFGLRRAAIAAAFVVLAILSAVGADEKPAARPAGVFVAASIDRLMADVETVTTSADRGDLYESLKGLLTNFGDFDGMDRTKPFGVLVFLGDGLVPSPEPIAFLPVVDQDKLLKTIAFGPIMTKPVEGKPGRYELAGPDGTVQLQFHGGHAFLAPRQVSLDRTFPDPQPLAKDLAEKYDLSASVDLSAIPAGLKKFAVGALRERVEADVRNEGRKPGVDEETLRIRREFGLAAVELFEDATNRGRSIQLGMVVSRETKSASVELRFLTDDKPQLGAAVAAPAQESADPAEVSLSFHFSEKNRVRLRDAALLAEKKLTASAKPEDLALITGILGPIQSTLEAGHVEFRASVVGAAPGPFSLVGAFELQKADDFATVLPRLLQRATTSPKFESVTTNALERFGIIWHRVVGKEASPQDLRLYGEKPSVLLGAGKNRAWFGIGGKPIADDLGRFVETEASRKPLPEGLRVRIAAGSWVAMSTRDGKEQDAGPRIARAAFARGKDGLTFEAIGTPSGPVVRLSIEEGFLRALGLAIGERVDRPY